MTNIDTESTLSLIEREAGKAKTMVQIIQGYGFEELGAVLSKDQAEKIAVEKLYISNELLVIFDALCNICEYTDALYKGMNTM